MWDKSYKISKAGWQCGLPETSCGGGSVIKKSEYLISWINDFIYEEDILSLADVGCGDFNWMSRVNLENVKYVGYDWVSHYTWKIHEKEHVEFIQCNAAIHPIQKADLAICRSVMIHLETDEAKLMLDNILASGPKWLLITSYDVPHNDRVLYNYAPLNLERPPFNLMDPLFKLLSSEHIVGQSPLKFLNLYHLNV